MAFTGFNTTFPSCERAVPPFNLHQFDLPYFETLLLGDKQFLRSILPRPDSTIVDEATKEKASPQAMTEALHAFLAETQESTRIQLGRIHHWTFIKEESRITAATELMDSIGNNIVRATNLINELSRGGSDVMVSSPDVPRPLELMKIGFESDLGHYVLSLQEYHKNLVAPSARPVVGVAPAQQERVQIPFHEDHVQFSLA